jgi:hypothetical protein
MASLVADRDQLSRSTRTNVGHAYVGDFSSIRTASAFGLPPRCTAQHGVLASLRAPGAPLRRLRRTWGPDDSVTALRAQLRRTSYRLGGRRFSHARPNFVDHST